MNRTSAARNFISRTVTIGQLIAHFSTGRRLFLLPILPLILVSSLILILAEMGRNPATTLGSFGGDTNLAKCLQLKKL